MTAKAKFTATNVQLVFFILLSDVIQKIKNLKYPSLRGINLLCLRSCLGCVRAHLLLRLPLRVPWRPPMPGTRVSCSTASSSQHAGSVCKAFRSRPAHVPAVTPH